MVPQKMNSDSSESHYKIQQALNEMDATYVTIEEHLDLKVRFGKLINKKGEILSYSSANGKEYLVKSIAESIEHFYYNQSVEANLLRTNSLAHINSQTELKKDKILKNINSDTEIPVYPFKRYNPLFRNHQVSLPAVWCAKIANHKTTLPNFRSSSGYSFGLDLKMSKRHSLLELIERHLVSKLYFALDNNQPYLVTRIDDLSENSLLGNYVKASDLEVRFEGKIKSYLINNEFEICTIISIFFPFNMEKYPLPQVASKSGFCFENTYSSCLNELTQILALYSDEERIEDTNVLQIKHLLLNCRESLFLNNIVETPLPQKANSDYINNLDDLVERLEDFKYYPLFRIIKEFKSGARVVQAFVPGFEKYNLIRSGIQTPTHF